MSYQEALEDNIPIKKSKDGFCLGYYPPCYYCGQAVYTWSYKRDVQYVCPTCRPEVINQKRAAKAEQAAHDKERKLKLAIKRIARVTDIAPYEKAIEYVRRHLEHS